MTVQRHQRIYDTDKRLSDAPQVLQSMQKGKEAALLQRRENAKQAAQRRKQHDREATKADTGASNVKQVRPCKGKVTKKVTKSAPKSAPKSSSDPRGRGRGGGSGGGRGGGRMGGRTT